VSHTLHAPTRGSPLFVGGGFHHSSVPIPSKMPSCILLCVAPFLALLWSPSKVFVIFFCFNPVWLLLLLVASLAVLLDVLVAV
ncbi:hypothetical protein HN51_004908, partial [Arachis hypogaea]